MKRLPGREWVPKREAWWVPAADLRPGTLLAAGFVVLDRDGNRPRRHSALSDAPPPFDTIPDWFGLDLAAYQTEGALAVVAGRWLLADPPGLGKTRQCLAVAALVGARRTVVVCPPVVVPHWARETELSGVAIHPDPSGQVTTIRAGRKQPALPDAGVVVLPDTLLAARQPLADELCAWAPDLAILDEAHRAKTWTSTRSRSTRMLAAASKRTVASTGTPMFASPYELAPILEATGQLRHIWGGPKPFMDRYTRTNRYKAVVARKEHLGELAGILDSQVWVRRDKNRVLDIPPKTRRSLWVDIDEATYRAAHAEVVSEIDETVASWESSPNWPPDDDTIWAWCTGRLELVTRLRRAAGLAKVPAAAEIVAERVLASGTAPDGGYSNPMVIWTHHRVVTEAMLEAARKALGGGTGRSAPVGAIMGGTPDDERTRLVDGFAAGKVAALICSITAAGVGITLTRASEALFVEVDWTPAVVTQAEDRVWRIGQTETVSITTLVAPGTLDEAIHGTLARKARTLDVVMAGGDHHVAASGVSPRVTATRILADIVTQRVGLVGRRRRTVKQAS